MQESACAGTLDAHWHGAHMGRELMTGFINTGAVNPKRHSADRTRTAVRAT